MTGPEPGFARADVVAGLARELAGLRRLVDSLPGELATVGERVDDLARIVAQLADTVAATPPRAAPSPARSWLLAPDDPQLARELLAELRGWLELVFLRYPDAREALPECWAWHPEVVEELLWLSAAWNQAYQGSQASAQLAGDWHDRQRPGVLRRLRAAAAACSRETHQHAATRPGWGPARAEAPKLHDDDTLDAIAGWWAEHRDQPAPEPPPRPAAARPPWPDGPGGYPSGPPGSGPGPGWSR